MSKIMHQLQQNFAPASPSIRSVQTLWAFAIWLLLCACSKAPSEALLLKTIDDLQTMGEARDASGMMAHIADDFSGQSGSMDRNQLRAYLMGIALRTQNVGITRTKTEVSMEGERAKVQIHMLVTDGGRILPSTGQLVEATTQWRFASGEWQLASAVWNDGYQQ
jgi:hypothetical protein